MSRQKGYDAEALACQYLIEKGFKLLDKNYTTKAGEIDLIMQDRETLVFVEVKNRASIYFGYGFEAVDNKKQQRLTLAAKQYLVANHKYDKMPCRFDVISIDNGDIQWFCNAF